VRASGNPVVFKGNLSEEPQRESEKNKMAESNALSRNLRSGSAQPRAVGTREVTPAGQGQPAGRRGSVPSREARDLYHSQSPWTLETNDQAGKRPELGAEEKILVEENSDHQSCSPWCA
jgi:hypothetical protein